MVYVSSICSDEVTLEMSMDFFILVYIEDVSSSEDGTDVIILETIVDKSVSMIDL